MSFTKYLAREIGLNVYLYAFVVVTSPLWLPIWVYITVANWIDLQRLYWEQEQKRAAGVIAPGDAQQGKRDA